jgi:hypothetical protein
VAITVPAGVDVLITADGATQIFSNAALGAVSTYNNFVVIDNSRGSPFFAVRQTSSVNIAAATQAVENWSVTRRFALSPGVHQIGLCSLFAGGSSSFYSGPVNSPLQSSMTVTFIAK